MAVITTFRSFHQSVRSFGLFVAAAAAPYSGCGSLFVGNAVQASERASRAEEGTGEGDDVPSVPQEL